MRPAQTKRRVLSEGGGESLYRTCSTGVRETVDRVTTQVRPTEVFREAVRRTSQAIIVDHVIIFQGRFMSLNA